MFQLIYLSQAKSDLNYSDLAAILESSRRHNPAKSITGILIYKDDQFLQLLEGNQEDVQAVMDKIAQDKRHMNISVLYQGDTAERFFADWSMGYTDGDVSVNDTPVLRRLFSMAQQYRPEMKEFIFEAMKELRQSKENHK